MTSDPDIEILTRRLHASAASWDLMLGALLVKIEDGDQSAEEQESMVDWADFCRARIHELTQGLPGGWESTRFDDVIRECEFLRSDLA